jgi:Flp pilus assembly protein TadG
MARGVRRAQAVVEFALILPVYMLILGGTIEFGRAFFAYSQLLQAVQDGVRYGAVLHKTDSEMTTRVQQAAPGGASDTVTIAMTASPTDNTVVLPADRRRGNLLRVTGQHNQRIAVPILPISAFALTANASMVIE